MGHSWGDERDVDDWIKRMQRTDGSTAGYGDDGAAFIASQLFGIHVVVYKVLKHTDVTQKRHRKFFNCAC